MTEENANKLWDLIEYLVYHTPLNSIRMRKELREDVVRLLTEPEDLEAINKALSHEGIPQDGKVYYGRRL